MNFGNFEALLEGEIARYYVPYYTEQHNKANLTKMFVKKLLSTLEILKIGSQSG